MTDRPIWARPVPTSKAGYVPANERRAATPQWTVKVTRRGRRLTLVMMAPSVEIAMTALRELEAAAWTYAKARRQP